MKRNEPLSEITIFLYPTSDFFLTIIVIIIVIFISSTRVLDSFVGVEFSTVSCLVIVGYVTYFFLCVGINIWDDQM